MPVLSNWRHERFAQELAAGKSATEAHGIAGYNISRFTASKLQRKPHIVQRVNEILAENEEIRQKSVAMAVERTGVDRAWVMTHLRMNARRALQVEPVLDADGVPIGEYRYEGSVANRSLELLGKEIGMFIDRKHVTHADAPAAEMPFEQLLAIAQGRVIEHRADEVVPDSSTDVSADDGSEDG